MRETVKIIHSRYAPLVSLPKEKMSVKIFAIFFSRFLKKFVFNFFVIFLDLGNDHMRDYNERTGGRRPCLSLLVSCLVIQIVLCIIALVSFRILKKSENVFAKKVHYCTFTKVHLCTFRTRKNVQSK